MCALEMVIPWGRLWHGGSCNHAVQLNSALKGWEGYWETAEFITALQYQHIYS